LNLAAHHKQYHHSVAQLPHMPEWLLSNALFLLLLLVLLLDWLHRCMDVARADKTNACKRG